MPEKKVWVWGFMFPGIPFVQQRFVPDTVVIQQGRRGQQVVVPHAEGANQQPIATPAVAPAAQARPAYAGRIADDDLAREDLEEARERERAADLELRAARALIMADLKTEAVWSMQNARTERTLAWARGIPAMPSIVSQSILDEVARRQLRRDEDRQDNTATTTTPRQPQRYALTINGTVVRQGQTRVNVPNGYVTLNPAPGRQGYDDGTQVTLIASPIAGAGVRWQGVIRTQGQPFRAIVTMDRNRQVQVTITPRATPATPGIQGQPTPGEAALDEQLQRATQAGY